MIKPEKIGRLGQLYMGDCSDILKTLPSNSITSIISDPPAGINFMSKNWDKDKGGRTEWISWLSEIMGECLRVIKPGGMIAIWAIPRTSHWTMTAIEDAGFIIKSKFYHHFGSGFPKSSSIPKSIDRKLGKERKIIGKREHPTLKDKSKVDRQNSTQYHAKNPIADEWELTESNSDEAKLFDGYGTSTKPSTEEWILAMAPLDKTYAENALKHGLAGINIDASRIAGPIGPDRSLGKPRRTDNTKYGKANETINPQNPLGRWPADLILQHHPECVQVGSKKVKGSRPVPNAKFHKHKFSNSNSKNIGIGYGEGRDGTFSNKLTDKDGNETIEDWKCHPQCPIRIIGEQSGVKRSGKDRNPAKASSSGFTKHGIRTEDVNYGDKGTAARFFLNLPADPGFLYCAKASPAEKNLGCENLPEIECQTGCGGAMPVDDRGKERDRFKKVATNFHPTCKPLKLMKYLVTLLAPPQNPVILDMFAGSGTTGVACEQLKIPFILIEKEAEYCDIIKARVEAANKPAQKKKIEKVKEKGKKQKGFFDLKKEGFV